MVIQMKPNAPKFNPRQSLYTFQFYLDGLSRIELSILLRSCRLSSLGSAVVSRPRCSLLNSFRAPFSYKIVFFSYLF